MFRILMLLLLVCSLQAVTLKEMYDKAGPGDGYDKVIRLETGKLYTGGLYIGNYFNHFTSEFGEYIGKNVKISGNGAILDLQGGQISIGYCENKLDIDSCVIINGNVRFHGYSLDEIHYMPTGSVRNVTFYKANDYCVRIEQAGEGVTVEKNIFVDCIGTGSDFEQYTGGRLPKIETGICVAGSAFFGWDGIPVVKDNWSYYSRVATPDLLRHYGFL